MEDRIYILKKSNVKNKRYSLINETTNEKYDFGHKEYDNYTIHKDEDRKRAYLKRSKNLNNNNELNNNTLARMILWNKPTIRRSIKDVEKKFNIIIKKKI